MFQKIVNNLDITTILTFLLVLLVSYVIWNYFFSVRINIPGPTPWPILGNLPLFIGTKDVGQAMWKLQKKYGNMMLIHFGPQPVVFYFGYKNVHEALVVSGEETKFRPLWLYLLNKLFPDIRGIFFTNGQRWSDGRRFTIVALKDFGVGKKSIDERINEEVDYIVAEFNKVPGKPVDVTTLFPKATSNVISNVVFGSRFSYDDPEFIALLSHVNFLFKNANFNSALNFFPWLDKILPSSNVNTEVAKHLQAVRDYIRSRIDKQRDSFDPGNIRNFLDLYLQQESDPDSKITEGTLHQVIADLYQAGTDTTSLTLQWCMIYMLNYPDVQKKCREEIIKVIGDGRYPSSKDKPTVPYVMATIREVQRIAAITPFAVPHGTFEDTHIAGKFIPKKTMIMCHLMSVLYDPEEWKDPTKFQPERFLDDKGQLIKPEAFVPFSMGPRTCLGKELATNEVFLFFTAFLQRFDLTTVNPGDVISTDGIQTGVTRQPIHPLHMCFRPL